MRRQLPGAVLILSLALSSSPLLAAPAHPAGPRSALAAERAPATAGLIPWIWSQLVALWGAEGCIIDPNGARCAATTTVHSAPIVPLEEGCIGDPNGCASQR